MDRINKNGGNKDAKAEMRKDGGYLGNGMWVDEIAW